MLTIIILSTSFNRLEWELYGAPEQVISCCAYNLYIVATSPAFHTHACRAGRTIEMGHSNIVIPERIDSRNG